jgi:hypothetical protein
MVLVESTIVEEDVQAYVGRCVERRWPLGGAGDYKLKISRMSAFIAHCRGSIKVVSCTTGEVLWLMEQWRSDRDGVDVNFSLVFEGQCELCVRMQAYHFASWAIHTGGSVARVNILRCAR